MKIKCGNANLKGNIKLTYKGGCRKSVNTEEAYRCVGCGGFFHKECIIKHFKLEEKHDIGRESLRIKIRSLVKEIFEELLLSFHPDRYGDLIKKAKKDILKQLK